MIYQYKKYKDIDDFVNNKPKSKKDESYTIVHKCKGLEFNGSVGVYNDHCFGCLFCVLNNKIQLKKYLEYSGTDIIDKVAENAFRGEIISCPKVLRGFRHPYSNLEKFTGIDETTNIQPWAAAILNTLSIDESRVSMEIPVFNLDYDRNGRLDIGVISNGQFLAVESKISLEEALKDERFIEQHIKYTVEIEKSTDSYLYLTLFGGVETDLFPEDSKYCSGKIGDKTKRFYEMIIKNNIQFFTANALWCLCCKYLKYGNRYTWNHILFDIFSNPECIGLLSAGAVYHRDGNIFIESLE